MKRKWLLGLILVIVWKMFFLVPIHISGGIAGVNKDSYTSLFSVLKDNSGCMDCFKYDIIYSRYIIELFLVISIYLLVYFIIRKIVKR